MASTETRPGLLEGNNILVMGLISPESFAWAIGEKARSEGANVQYTVQNERFIRIADRAFRNQGIDLAALAPLPCDVTSDEDIQKLAKSLQAPLDGLVYSIAFANPKTTLTGALYEAPRADIKTAIDISAVSLPMVIGALLGEQKFHYGASIVAMTFDSQRTYPNYNWMGVAKAALEAEVRYLARDLGSNSIRINSLSAGPQNTLAATHIPGFANIGQVWSKRAPLGWDLDRDREVVARSAIYFLSELSKGVTAEIHHVDGGFHSVSLPVDDAKTADLPKVD